MSEKLAWPTRCLLQLSGTKNWSSGAIHSAFGAMAIALAVGQPLNATMRCAPSHSRRLIFNFGHRLLGVVVWTCGGKCIQWMLDHRSGHFAAVCLGVACRCFEKRLFDTSLAFALFLLHLLLVGGGSALLEWTTRQDNQHSSERRVSEAGRPPKRRVVIHSIGRFGVSPLSCALFGVLCVGSLLIVCTLVVLVTCKQAP